MVESLNNLSNLNMFLEGGILMTRAEGICNLITMLVSFAVATALLADVVKNKESRGLKAVLSIILAVYASLGLSTFIVLYDAVDFELWKVGLLSLSIFSVYPIVSIYMGLRRLRKDEEKKWRLELKKVKPRKPIMSGVMKDNFVERVDDCYYKD